MGFAGCFGPGAAQIVPSRGSSQGSAQSVAYPVDSCHRMTGSYQNDLSVTFAICIIFLCQL